MINMLFSAALSLAAGPFTMFATEQAAPPKQQSDDAIVIQGTRPSDHQVRDFVKALTSVPSYGQIGRFHAAVCPVAMGLPQVQNDQIADRMRRVAAAATIKVAPAKCTPNAFVIVAPDKAAAITELQKRFPAYLSQMTARQVRELADSPEPAAAWQVKGLLTADGLEAAKATGHDYYTVKSADNPSHIKASSKPTFNASVVVIDVKAAAGLTLTQLADYAAMRTFADIAPARVKAVGVPTILGALGSPEDKLVPVTLTYWDLGFLKSLYSTDNSYLATYQRGDMEHVLTKVVETSDSDPKK